ncbi:protein kinase C-binding protein NELL2-like [Dreissena polymorpha]|uniref:protein kinase C-binding protein NELL2-like n=1 Tax=Dreissena polymorpha TaxID=45954 RepID=UPI002263F22F|nr:protein kinase C-binding protein NELL2-like [Dreissena polymorpha]
MKRPLQYIPSHLFEQRCICDPGWQKRNGPKSPCNIDVNECLQSEVCEKTQMCINTKGSYICESQPSWTRNNSVTDNSLHGSCDNCSQCMRTHCKCPESVTCPTCPTSAEIVTHSNKDSVGNYICESHPSWTGNNSVTDNKDILAVLPDRILVYVLFGLLCLMLLIIILLSCQLCHRTRERSRKRNFKAPEQLRTSFGCVQYFI